MSNDAPGRFHTQSLRNQASAIRADATEAEQDWLEVADSLDAAAAEVDRLRDEVAEWKSYSGKEKRSWQVENRNRKDAEDESFRLRAVIENAPHAADCEGKWCPAFPRAGYTGCTCWKATAIGS